MTTVTITEEVINIVMVAEQGPPGVSADHSLLLNLDADTHLQYHTDARGDARYSQLGHNHDGMYEPADVAIQSHLSSTSNPHSVTAAQVGADTTGTASGLMSTHEAGTGVHSIAGVTGLQTALDGKSATTHDHASIYAPIANGVMNGDSHDHSGGDGAQIAYSGLSGLPTLGSAAATDSTAYATAAQGSTADTALQPGDDAAGLGSAAATDGYVLTADGIGGSAWEAVVGTGTVTSVAVSGSDGIEVDSGSPVTSSGTIALGVNASALQSHLGLGTAAYTASTAYATAMQGGKADTAVQPGGALGTPSSGTLTNCSGYPIPAVKLDDAGAPDDNTDLDATTSAHGLLPKLGGGTSNFLRADGTWSAPAGGGDVAGDTHAATSKTTPVDADELPLVDSAASYVLKKLTWANLKTTLSSVFAVLAGKSGGQTIIGGTGTTDSLVLQSTSGVGATGAQIKLNVGNNGATNALTILNNGKVGIGNTSPSFLLDIGWSSSTTNKLGMSGTQMLYLPNQTNFVGTLIVGNGGGSLTHTTDIDGFYNTFVGVGAGNANTTGSYNTANGAEALYSNTTGISNTANGFQSLYFNTTGSYSTANGFQSLYFNTTGSYSTANGFSALTSNTTGSYNTANGTYSLGANTTGSSNTANGSYSLVSNTTGNNNTANGTESLVSNTTGDGNVANGYQSLYSNTTGNNNTTNGVQSLYLNTTGSGNTAFGFNAGNYQADGSTDLADPENSIYIGYNAKGFSNADDNSIVIGYNAVGIGANTVVLGNDSVVITALKGNVGIGTTSPSAKIHAIKTTEQLRLGYNATYYSSFTVNSSGALTQTAIAGQTFIGGTGVTSKIVLQGTSANGTSTASAIEMKTGNNGAVTAMTLKNDGNIYVPGILENTTSGEGIVLKSPDGTRYKVTVANGGTLSVSAA